MVSTLKHLFVLVVLFFAASSAIESYSRVRVYKDFLQQFFSQNLRLVLERAQKSQLKDVHLQDIHSHMTQVDIQIQPRNGDWQSLQLEMFFDDGQIVLAGHDLEFTGTGMIEDPGTRAQEKIQFTAPMSTMQMVFSLGEEYAQWGALYPRLNIEQVTFQLNEPQIVVSVFGNVPLYQSHQFETAVKKWFMTQSAKRQEDFKQSLQILEKNMWKSFPFSRQILGTPITLNTSLSEPLRLHGDYLYASFLNEIVSQYEFAELDEKLVIVKAEFSNDNEYQKDVQLTIDENLVNNQLIGLFNADKVFSLTEIIIGWIPDSFKNYGPVLQNMFTTLWFSKAFPELVQEHGQMKRVDVRCGFSKQFLKGKIEDTHMS